MQIRRSGDYPFAMRGEVTAARQANRRVRPETWILPAGLRHVQWPLSGTSQYAPGFCYSVYRMSETAGADGAKYLDDTGSAVVGRQSGRESLGQDRTEDRCHEHQHKDYVEHAIIEQALAGGA